MSELEFLTYFFGFLFFLILFVRRISVATLPKYFCDGSRRVVLGDEYGEFHIQVLQIKDTVETWLVSRTIKGWPETLEYISQENDRHEEVKKALKIDKRQ